MPLQQANIWDLANVERTETRIPPYARRTSRRIADSVTLARDRNM